MSMDGFIAPIKSKRPKNTMGLSLTAESLAPPPTQTDDSSNDQEYDLNAYITQATPRLGSSGLRVEGDEMDGNGIGNRSGNVGGEINNGSTSTKDTLLLPLKPSRVSRKKPAGLGIKSTRPAPEAPGVSSSTYNQLDPDSLSPTRTSTSTHTSSSRAEVERQLASMEISSSSTSRPSSSKASGSGGGTGGTIKKTRKKPSSSSVNPSSLSETGSNGFPELRDEDLKVVGELGAGNGGTVNKVLHKESGLFMAKKLVLIDAKPAVRKQILRELQIMHHCNSEWIVSFYGAFLCDVHVGICMEYMDRRSLDGIYKKHGAVQIEIVGRIAEAVLRGLTYLYDEHRIMHRDIKPSNILVNSKGDVKICDFGVSGELINSVANTFVGTSTYMSPERIQGGNYSVKSDIWSLGISLIELALGRFPFRNDDSDDDDDDDNDSDLEEMRRTITCRKDGNDGAERVARSKPPRKPKAGNGGGGGGGGMNMSILDLLQHIVNEPAPRLSPVPDKYPIEAERFVEDCLRKEPKDRKSPKELLLYPWIVDSRVTKSDLEKWAISVD